MATCANGHDSDWDDFCSSCGIAMGGAADKGATAGSSPADPAPADPDAAASGDGCPNCGEAHADTDVFCENCGYDFLAGSMPGPLGDPDPAVAGPAAALAAAEADGGAGASESSASGAAPVEAVPAAAEAAAWKLVISVDREYFDRMSAEGQLDFPDPVPEPTEVPLGFEKGLVGRRSESRGVFPEIDVLALTGDPAVSTRHAMIERAADDSYTITDLDSTNGTYLGDSSDPAKPGVASPLASGSAVYVGAWTKLQAKPT